jgi:hypothetical protein
MGVFLVALVFLIGGAAKSRHMAAGSITVCTVVVKIIRDAIAKMSSHMAFVRKSKNASAAQMHVSGMVVYKRRKLTVGDREEG